MQRKRLFALIAVTVYGFFGISMSILAPLFPNKAFAKGLSRLQIGLVSSGMQISAFFATILFMMIMRPADTFFMFTAGPILCFSSCILMGVMGYSPNGEIFEILCFALTLTSGVGGTMFVSSAYSIISFANPDLSKSIGSYIEMADGIGVVIGPTLATVLYSMGGYATPFVCIGVFAIILVVIAVMIAPPLNVNEEKSTLTVFAFLKLAIKPYILLIMITIVFVISIFGMIDTMVSPHLKDHFKLSQDVLGYVYLAMGVTYVFASGLSGYLVEKGHGGILFVVSIFCIPFSILTMYLTTVFELLDNLTCFSIALALIGLAAAGAFVPCYLLLEKYAMYYGIKTASEAKVFVSFMICLVYGAGGALGPIFTGGFVFGEIGFANTLLVEIGLLCLGVLCTLPLIFYQNLLGPLELPQINENKNLVDADVVA